MTDFQTYKELALKEYAVEGKPDQYRLGFDRGFNAGFNALCSGWMCLSFAPSDKDILVLTDDGVCIANVHKGHLWNMPSGFHDSIPKMWHSLPNIEGFI